jgi:hypothetical protein
MSCAEHMSLPRCHPVESSAASSRPALGGNPTRPSPTESGARRASPAHRVTPVPMTEERLLLDEDATSCSFVDHTMGCRAVALEHPTCPTSHRSSRSSPECRLPTTAWTVVAVRLDGRPSKRPGSGEHRTRRHVWSSQLWPKVEDAVGFTESVSSPRSTHRTAPPELAHRTVRMLSALVNLHPYSEGTSSTTSRAGGPGCTRRRPLRRRRRHPLHSLAPSIQECPPISHSRPTGRCSPPGIRATSRRPSRPRST